MSENNEKGAAKHKGASGKSAGTSKSPRRRAREFALQGLYQWRVGGADEAAIEAHLQDVAGFDKADRNFFLGLLRGSLKLQEPLREALQPYLDRKFDELSPIEACILMVGAYELQAHPETPYRVVINEAIELAKSYGGTDGHKYVNGVLDKLAAKLRPVEVEARQRGK
ncbi:transcription antitermination factor NusB [Azospira restricta]|uniref:Transcription antitermination protein NusB n=1 Tax=Azospira restricta TaxID=404405 RepID=A0A974Y465_9RHOO|nr:transcription antitermination factor NusB [Azospira restricta]QRJ64293.1 transcription antitermination factor NusB [Azospira restricta]